MRNVTVGPFKPWLVPESQAESEALAAQPHDPAARPCWCGECQKRRRGRGVKDTVARGPLPGVDVGYGRWTAKGVNPAK